MVGFNALVAQVNLNQGLVAYYPFNGNANDVSGNGNNGILMNGVALTTDRFGNANSAYHFDGINDYIKILDDGSFSTSKISISLWFLSESSNLQCLIGKKDFTNTGGSDGSQYQMFINYPPFPGVGSNLVGNNSTCTSISNSSYINTQDQLCNYSWNNMIVTFDGSRHKLYLNGVLKRDEPTTFNGFLTCNSELRFGNWWQQDLLPVKGKIDDVRWYNRALNIDEVTSLSQGAVNCQQVTSCNNWLSTPNYLSTANIGNLNIIGNKITIEATFNCTSLNGNFWGHLVAKHTDPGNVCYALAPNGPKYPLQIMDMFLQLKHVQ